jgi:Domain of unknown function (DUF5666)
MKFYKAFSFLTLLACLSLGSCYHEFPNGGGGGGGGGNNNGNTILNLFVTATPTTTFSFPGITWEIDNISLVNNAGTTISLGGGFGAPFFTYPQLQTDSAYFGFTTVKATSYTKLLVTFGPALFSYVYNGTNATMFSGANACAPGIVCLIPSTVPGFGANSTPISVPINYTTTSNTNTGIRVNFDFSKAVTTAGADGMTFDFTKPGAITLIADPPTSSSQTSGIDTIDNFTGVVTATTATTVTVKSFSSEPHTFTFASKVEYDDPFTLCNQPATAACLAVGQNVSIDGFIASDSFGTRTATEIEFLDPAPGVNELEGVIISPVTNNQFKMILTNGMGANTTIVSAPVLVNLSNATTYPVDPKNLNLSPTGNLGFQSQADLVMGQTVMVQGGTFSGNNTSITNPTRVLLRYSSISGTVQAPGANIFTLAAVSPFFTNLTANTVLVNTFPNTAYDNISGFAGLSSVTSVSVRGLYLNPNSGATQPLLAAKIRSH